MNTVLRRLGQQTSIYTVGVVLSRLASFIMLPIYTSYLTPEDYGILEMLSLTVEVIGIIGMMGLSAGVMKFHAEYDSAADKNEVLSTATLGIMALSLFVAAAGVLLSPWLSHTVLGAAGRPHYFRLFFLIYVVQQWEIVPWVLLRIQNRAWTYVTLALIRLTAMLALNIWLVVFERMGVLGVLLSNLLTTGVMALGLLAFQFQSAGARLSRDKLVRMARFGLPMMVYFISSFVLTFSDRYFLRVFTGVAEVGLYSLAYRFVYLLSALVFTPFQNAWDPERFRLAKAANKGDEVFHTFRQVFTYLNFSLAFAGLGISLFTREVLLVMADEAFHAAYLAVPMLVAAQILFHWVNYANLGLLLRDRTDILGTLSVVSAGAVIVVNYILIPPFGMVGAALATLAAYGFRYVIVLVASQRLFHIPYDWYRVGLTYGVVSVAVAIKFALVKDMSLLPSLALGSALVVLTAAVAYAWILTEAERSVALAAVTRIAAPFAKRGGKD